MEFGMAMEFIHDEVLVPEDRVFVEVCRRVEGEVVLLRPEASAVHIHVRL